MTSQNQIAHSLTLPYSKRIAPNRLVKAATTEQLADPTTNHPNDELGIASEYFAKGGVGILLTGNVHVDRRYMEATRNVAAEEKDLRDPVVMAKWRKWAKACKGGEGGKTLSIVQISHGGRQVPRSVNWWSSLAPSSVSLELAGIPQSSLLSPFAPPRAATLEDIEDIINRFVIAAKISHEAGFDGIQVHSAHGYLLSTFLSPKVNKRVDAYGGNPENRSRLLCEIVQRIRKELPSSFVVSVKLNTADFQKGGFTEEESLLVSRRLAHLGVDFIEYSGGTYECAAMMGKDQKMVDTLLIKNNNGAAVRQSTRERESFFIDFVDKARVSLKEEPPMMILLTGGWRSGKAMNDALTRGAVDLIGLARPLLVEPNFANRLLTPVTYSGDSVQDVTALDYEITQPYHFLPESLRQTLSQQLQASWHIVQIHRFGQGETQPDMNLPFGPFLLDTVRHLVFDPKKYPKVVLAAQVAVWGMIGVVIASIAKHIL